MMKITFIIIMCMMIVCVHGRLLRGNDGCDCSSEHVSPKCGGCNGVAVPSVKETCVIGNQGGCHQGKASPSREEGAYRVKATYVPFPSAATPKDCAPNIRGVHRGNCHWMSSGGSGAGGSGNSGFCGGSAGTKCQSTPTVPSSQPASVTPCSCNKPAPHACECDHQQQKRQLPKPSCQCPKPQPQECGCSQKNPSTPGGPNCHCASKPTPPCPCNEGAPAATAANTTAPTNQTKPSASQATPLAGENNNATSTTQQSLPSKSNATQSPNVQQKKLDVDKEATLDTVKKEVKPKTDSTGAQPEKDQTTTKAADSKTPPPKSATTEDKTSKKKDENVKEEHVKEPTAKSAGNETTTKANTTANETSKGEPSSPAKVSRVVAEATKSDKSDDASLEAAEKEYRMAQAKASIALKRQGELSAKFTEAEEAEAKASQDGLKARASVAKKSVEEARKRLDMSAVSASNAVIAAKNALIGLEHARLSKHSGVEHTIVDDVMDHYSKLSQSESKDDDDDEVHAELKALVSKLTSTNTAYVRQLKLLDTAVVAAAKARTSGAMAREAGVKTHIEELKDSIGMLRESGKEDDLKSAVEGEKQTKLLEEELKRLMKSVADANVDEKKATVKGYDEMLSHLDELISQLASVAAAANKSKFMNAEVGSTSKFLQDQRHEIAAARQAATSEIGKQKIQVQAKTKHEEDEEDEEEEKDDEDRMQLEHELTELVHDALHHHDPPPPPLPPKQQVHHRSHVNTVVTNNNGLSIDLTDGGEPQVTVSQN